MGISSALYSGVSGLNTNSQAMSVIGNNLANTNTVGFKGSRTVFSDLLASTVFGSGGTSQVGRGVGMSKVDNIFSQGTFESTETSTDVAIEGEGFFLLKETGSDSIYYSRAGAFRFDEDGYLVNPEGFQVQGQEYNDAGEIQPGDPKAIQVQSQGLIPAQATTDLVLNTNLDSGAVIPPALDFEDPLLPYDPTTNPIDVDTTTYISSTQCYDSLGEEHLVTLYFRKSANNTWDVHWTAEDITGLSLNANPETPLAAAAPSGPVPLTFSQDGKILDQNGVTSDNPLFIPIKATLPALDFQNGANPVNITIEFDTTQFNNASRVISQNQNGFSAGNLTSVVINSDGDIVASYSNGEQKKKAALSLAKFTNPNGLDLAGSNLFQATTASGAPRVGLPGPELGKVFTNSLEQSNVDMGKEFVNMISIQRGFQANSKIITTVDELLGELINLKR